MVNYRRNYLTGGMYFFTVNLQNRQSTLLTEYITPLRGALRAVQQHLPFNIIAMVVLPEHLHALWKLPAGDADYSQRWRAIKSQFTRSLIKQGVKLQNNKKGEYFLWQRRFWEHTIRDEPDLERHINYIHYNPVKHGLVERVSDWPHSSFGKYVKLGRLPIDWCGTTPMENDAMFGE
jgi:putative transposase